MRTGGPLQIGVIVLATAIALAVVGSFWLRFRPVPPPRTAPRLPRCQKRRNTGTGWSGATVGSSPSARPSSTARPGTIHLQRPVVGITPTPDHRGYWLVAADGGIFAFGDAGFYGSIPGIGIAPAGSGRAPVERSRSSGWSRRSMVGGYFMVASDGGVFAFGDARFEGSCPGIGGCGGAAKAVMPDASGNGILAGDDRTVASRPSAMPRTTGSRDRRTSSFPRPHGPRRTWLLDPLRDGVVFRYRQCGQLRIASRR